MIQGRHEIEGAAFTDYIWGEHLIDEGIMKWGEHPHTGEKVLELVDPDDNDPETSTHRRVAGEWIIQNVLNHPLLIENIVANGYKVKVIFYITGGMTQLVLAFLSSWVRLTAMEIHLETATYNPQTKTYIRRGWL
jgi:hypothetical protein